MGLQHLTLRTSVSNRLLLLAGTVLLLASCLNPTGQNFSMDDAGEGLPDPDKVLDIYASSGDGTNSWEVVHSGELPRGDFDAGGIVATDNAVYMAVDEVSEGKPGIYRLAQEANSWELHLDGSDFNYRSISGLAYHPDDEHLYFQGHSSIYRVETGTGGPYKKSDKGGPLELVLSEGDTDEFSNERLKRFAVIPDGGGATLVVQKSGAGDPEFYTLDADAAVNSDGNASSALTSTNFRSYSASDDLDGKPHVDLFADASGRIYFVTNYSGIHRYNGSWSHILEFPNDYTEKDSAPVGAGLAGNGTLYASYERRFATQIATVFRHDEGSSSWEQVYETQGYSPDINAVNDGSVMAMTGRFGNTIINASDKRAYGTPSPLAGLNLSSDERKNAAVHGSAHLGDSVYVVQGIQKAGHDAKRVIRLTADLSTMPFYTWNLTTNGKNNFGVSGNATAVETAILSDGTVLAAYNDINSDGNPVSGTLVESDTSATDAGNVSVPNGEVILDLSAHPGGSGFALATTGGVYWYDSDTASAETLVSDDSDKKRVDVGSDGTVVALLDNGTVGAWSSTGTTQDISDGDSGDYLSLGRSKVEDVAVSDGENLFYVVGFDNKSLSGGNPVQVAYLEARSLSGGDSRWQRFGFDGGNLSNNIADTRLYHVEVAHGELLLGGEAAGPQNIFRFDGESYSGGTDQTLIDTYNAPWLSGGAPHISYVGRFAPGSGDFRNGQVTQTILSNGDYNTLRADALTIDADGRLYLGGTAAARMANRGGVQIDGTPLADYSGADPSLLVTNREQTTRHTWVSFNTTDGGPTGSVTGLSSRSIGSTDYAAALIDVEDGGIYLTVFSADENFEH